MCLMWNYLVNFWVFPRFRDPQLRKRRILRKGRPKYHCTILQNACKHVISSQTETLAGEIQKNLGAPAATRKITTWKPCKKWKAWKSRTKNMRFGLNPRAKMIPWAEFFSSRKKSAKGCSSILTKVVNTVPPLVKPNGGTVEYWKEVLVDQWI